MNYKKIFCSQKTRFTILRMLRWIPDCIMIPLQYRIKLGRWPNLKDPQRYTEKLQVYKMKYRNPVMSICVDKFEVREYVKQKGFESILVPLIGVYDDPGQIVFEDLPMQFVIKSTDGGGGRNVIVCKDKTAANWEKISNEVKGWLSAKSANAGREWAYTGIKNKRIIVEEFIGSGERSLIDYKFFCFNGEPKCLYVITDRKNGEYAYFGVYDMDFIKLDVYRCDERKAINPEPQPQNFPKMVEIARQLSAGFPHVRVDLYNVNGAIFFGELTFYDGSGYFRFDPDEFDYKMGSWFTGY